MYSKCDFAAVIPIPSYTAEPSPSIKASRVMPGARLVLNIFI